MKSVTLIRFRVTSFVSVLNSVSYIGNKANNGSIWEQNARGNFLGCSYRASSVRIAIRLPTDATVYFVQNLFPFIFTIHVSGYHKPIIRGLQYCNIAIRLLTDATVYCIYFLYLPYMFRALISPSSGVCNIAILQ